MSQIFVGIDLGTTNSVIAWGAVTPGSPHLKPQEIAVQMKSRDGGLTRRKTLPSVIYMNDPDNPVVGEFARALFGVSPHVVKSVKSRMGTAHRYTFQGTEFTPAELSARILQHLASEALKNLGFRPDVAVVTVPASFDSDMRSDTLEAARIADFKVPTEEGDVGVVLLDEPRAALYDFINRQARGEIASTLIDFSEPRTVLVYDLGGGTLDVSVHRISNAHDLAEAEIEDLGISRFTQLGGDDFDRALARSFMQEFLTRHRMTDLDDDERIQLENLFVAIAEEAKVELTSEIETALTMLGRDPETIELEISKARVFRERSFETTLTPARYREAIAALMAESLVLGDLDRIDGLSDRDNLVFPVLDALRKARTQLGHVPRVDAVLLNGGMTRVHAVQDRIHRLFGFAPLTVGDPDHSVARGAVVYHHMLSQGKRAKRILNESVGVAIQGGFVRQLAAAGSVLPHVSPVFQEFAVLLDGTTRIEIPFFVGEGRETAPPNRRIASRTLKFPKPLRENDGISLQVHIDESSLMKVEAWLTAQPSVRFEVALSTRTVEAAPPPQPETGGPRGVGSTGQGPTGSGPTAASPPGAVSTGGWKPPAPDQADVQGPGDALDIRSVLGQLQGYLAKCRQGSLSQDRVLHHEIMTLEAAITQAENARDCLQPLVDMLRKELPDEGRGRLVLLVGNLIARNPTHQKAREAYIAAMSRLLDPVVWTTETEHRQKQRLNGYGRFAIEGLGKTADPAAAPLLEALLASSAFDAARQNLLFSLGKTARTSQALPPLVKGLRSPMVSERIASAWALGKVGMRERPDPLPMADLVPALRVVMAQSKIEKHPDARRNQFYALAELGDRRGPGPHLPDDVDGELKQVLFEVTSQVSRKRSLIGMDPIVRMAMVARTMNEGTLLTEVDEAVLLTIRSQLK